jgi:CheY-like chemotaxis protein
LRGKAKVSAKEQDRLTILVVEDEWVVRLSIVDFLLAQGCEVIEAADGEAAAEVLQRQNGVDVVFTDIRLGGEMNGWDVGELSRQTHPRVPVVYTSGLSILPERRVPGSAFLAKPYSPEQVLAVCRELCADVPKRHSD